MKIFANALSRRQKLMLEFTHGCETVNVFRQKQNLKTNVMDVLKRRLVGRVVEEQSNVSFDSRVHLWPRESARCKISPVKAEVAPLEHNCKNNDRFQTRFKKNLPPFPVTSVYVCYTSQNTCKNEQKTTGSLLRMVLLGHIPFLNPFKHVQTVRNLI